MLPVIIGAVIVVGLVVAGGGVAIVSWARLKGSSVVLIGPKMSGKTTWRTFLEKGSIPEGYEHTILTDRVEKDFKLGNLKLKLKLTDLSGSNDAIAEWKKAARDADYLFFMVDVHKLANQQYQAKSLRYARMVAAWTLAGDITLAMTHADLDDAWRTGDYDALRTRDDVAELKSVLGAARVVVGDLSTVEGCQEFTVRALDPIAHSRD